MNRNEEFIKLLTSSQSALYACILALLPDRVAAQDILQETNLTLWRKMDEFEIGTNFMAWATRIARYHILNYRRRLSRDRRVFDEPLFEDLCEIQSDRCDDANAYSDALRRCLARLPADQRELLMSRYSSGGSVKQIAESRQQSVGAISQALYRIRETLVNCVSQQVQGRES
ncbi:sigma-70 family RNA polymerase sigma factor [Schlesneria sp. T3-172]|uniref:sigma-70 family RNA polymerase sigma factor n=1 Tax=Schlesneria sphaerica TaxID=3373610 RepID=UPI0037CC3295